MIGSGPKPDYKQAIDNHMKAISTAERLLDDQHPAIRLAAKEVLIDAHLGAAHDVAWGNWNQKEIAVSRWLSRASELAVKLAEDENWAAEKRFQIAVRAMAAYVGTKGQLDPTEWTEETIRAADTQIAAAKSPLRKQQILWELATALYDAVQIYQIRGEYPMALKCGEQAVECIEQVVQQRETNAADNYLLGRLYFRLGAIHAINSQDHQTAVAWFEKAGSVFDGSIAPVDPAEIGRLGETLVSMGVSYWETGQREKAVELTTRGAGLIQQAVRSGSLEESAMEVPTSNLASMRRFLGKDDREGESLQNASKDKDTILE